MPETRCNLNIYSVQLCCFIQKNQNNKKKTLAMIIDRNGGFIQHVESIKLYMRFAS